MKKAYIQPTISVLHTGMSLPVAASLAVDSTAHDGVSGDVKERGDWDIWGSGE